MPDEDPVLSEFIAALRELLRSLEEQLVALATKISRTRVPNPDGTLDGQYPNGDKDPTPATANWDNAALQAGLGNLIAQQTTGTALNHDVRQYATGTAAATATISCLTLNGDDVTAEGFNQPGSGDNLTHAGDNTGSGVLRLGLTVSGNTVLSDPIPWSYIALNPTNTLAPSAVTGLKGTPVTNGIDWSMDTALSAHDGTNLGNGVKEIDLELNGNVTVVTCSPGITTAPTVTNIGTISDPGAPSATQGAGASGRNWTLVAAGTGIDGVSDQCVFVGWPVEGNCRIIAKVNSFTGTGSQYAPAGVMIRETLNPDSKYVAMYQWLSALTKGVEGKRRSTTGGTKVGMGNAVGTSTARWVMVERTGDTFNVAYSTDGREWQYIGIGASVPMTSAVWIGGFTTSFQAGSEVTAALHDLNPSALPRVTYSQSTTSATTARARARDLAASPNVGAYSALSESISPIVSSVPLTKWYPGWYLFVDTPDVLSTSVAAEVSAMRATTPEMQGMGLMLTWKFLEPNKNDYSGVTTLVNWVNTLWNTYGLRTFVLLEDNSFAGSARAPTYLTTESTASPGLYQKNAGGWIPTIWDGKINDRAIALFNAIGAALDTHPGFVAIQYRELSTAFGTTEFAAAAFTPNAYFAQLHRWATEAKVFFPHTNLIAPGNFGENSFLDEYVEHCYQSKVGVGGPDNYVQEPYRTSSSTQGLTGTDRVIVGQRWNGSTWVSGFFDYRGKLLIANQSQNPDFGRNSKYNYNPTELWNYIRNLDGMPQGMVPLWRKTTPWTGTSSPPANTQAYWGPNANQPDPTMIFKTFLTGNSRTTYTAPPEFYGGNVETG